MIGRNDPWPCGSGKKFKKCCLNRNGAATPLYLPAERSSALAKLMHFAGKAKYEALHHRAFALFWGDWLSEMPEPRMKEVMASESRGDRL